MTLTRDIEEAKRRVAEATKELSRLENEQAKLVKLGPEYQLAEALHGAQCRLAHEDQCGWYYESWDKPLPRYSSRFDYLEKARTILAEVSLETALKMIHLMGK